MIKVLREFYVIIFDLCCLQNDDDHDICDNIPEPLNDQADVTVLEIPTDFEGAPERVRRTHNTSHL